MLRLTVFALLAISSSAFATKLTVSLPDGGPYLGWAAEGPGAPPAKAVRTRSTQIDLETTDFPGAKFVYVQDELSGKLAKLPLKAGADTITITAKEFTRLFKGEITVLRQGTSPIDAAVVSIDGQKSIIGAASQGIATFYDVPTGSVKVTVEYNIGKAAATPIVQIVDLSKPVTIQAAGEATVVPKTDGSANSGSAAAPVEEGKAKPVKDNAPNPFGSMVVTLGAVVVIVGLGFAALKYYQSNSSTVNEQLERLGVQVPKPPDDDLTSGDPTAPPTFKAPQPVQKIVLDPVAPVDLASSPTSMPATPPVTMSTGYPSLLTTDGETLALNEGETIVGREAGLGLSLTGESSVSRNHARFIRVGNQVTLEDMGSTNGSFVNGAKLTSSTVLRPGDEVRFGAITFRYQG